MKITKTQLQQIIKEEMQNVLKELGGRPADRPERETAYMDRWEGMPVDDPGTLSPAELRAMADSLESDFELRKISKGYLIVDKESGVAVLGPYRDKQEAEEQRRSIERNPDYRP
jgi:hypothetical protein